MAQILDQDQREVSWQQSRRAAYAIVMAKLIENLIEVVYHFGAGATAYELQEPNGAWKLTLRTQYRTPRIMVHIEEPTLREKARDVLRTLSYRVSDKDDHLVVEI